MDGPDDNHSAPNLSDVMDVLARDTIDSTQPSFNNTMGPAIRQSRMESMSPHSPSLTGAPYIQIVEQPAPKETRFRYKCEGRSAGSIPGASSTADNKTHPKVKIMNYVGKAAIVVSCVTKNEPYKAHPHNLVGKDCRRGVCTVEVCSDDMSVSFPNLGIQCVKKKDIEEALREREEIRVDPFRMGFSHGSQPGNIDLNVVRLCFQAFLEDSVSKRLSIPLQPVVSEPVHDKKAVQELTICKLSQCSASAGGGTDIILLCEKVVKEDITVRFFEERDHQVVWEALADFTPSQVHKQCAISFKTPKYASLQIQQPVKVYVELKRPSDGATSEARQFTIYPVESEGWDRKRRKLNPLHEYNQSPDVESRGLLSSDASLRVKREPGEAVSLSPGLYAGGTVTANPPGIRNTEFSRSPSPNFAAHLPQTLGTMAHQLTAISRPVSSPYHRVPITSPTHTYQPQGAYRADNSLYQDYNIPGPSTYTDLDTQQTVSHANIVIDTQQTISQINIVESIDVSTEELKRITIEENTQAVGEMDTSYCDNFALL